MGFFRSMKQNVMKTVGRLGNGLSRVASVYAPAAGKILRKGIGLVDKYAPIASRIVGHVGKIAAAGAGFAGSLSTGNIPGAVASGLGLVSSIKGGVKEVKSAFRKGKKQPTVRNIGKLMKGEGGEGSGGMSGDLAGDLKRMSGSN